MEFKFPDDTYQYLFSQFKKEQIQSRYQWVSHLLLKWIQQKGYENRVAVLQEAVEHVITDYFADIYRLKEFSGIAKTNEIKIYAYLAFWLLRRKPLQVIDTASAEDLVFVNEEMVADLLMDFMYNDPDSVPIVKNKKDDLALFEDTLRYYFKYRAFTAQDIELLLLAFQAGRGYQYSVDYRQ